MSDAAGRWNERYGGEGFAYGEEPNDFLAEHAAEIPPGRVLCLADGEGRNSVWLARQGYEVTSVDLSPVGVEKAKRLAARHGVNVNAIAADLADFDIEENHWQGIVAIYAHVPLATRKRMHAACVKGLVPGGVFILESYSPDQPKYGTGGPKERDFLMSEQDMRSELAGLQFEIAHEIVREILEGRYHTGEGAVVQVLARKPG